MTTEATTKPSADNRSSRVKVLEAIRALSNYEMPVTSDSIARHTGLRSVTVADCIKELKERDEIWSPERGVYRMQRGETSMSMSFTPLPCGGCKIEKGDVVLELNHHEWRTQLAPVAAAGAALTIAIEHAHSSMLMREELSRVKRRLRTLEERGEETSRQMSLA
jgi:hypothetical protein